MTVSVTCDKATYKQFTEYKWHETLVLNNGPLYNDTVFNQAMKCLGVHHITGLLYCH